MLCLLAVVVISQTQTQKTTWYGPATVTVPIPFTGDPYDPEANDVVVDFQAPNGVKLRRIAYYVGEGKFAATLVAPTKGVFDAHFIRNGQDVADISNAVDLQSKLKHGFIGLKDRHFAWTDGAPYFPIGYDYAWQSIRNETVPQGMAKMGAQGANWSRIWADHWDGKNPFWPADKDHPIPGRQLRQEPLQTWDQITAAAEQAGVSFQFVLFHHGPYSTTTDSNWADHPWNTKNGGFLTDPTDFFTNPEAKRRTKIWLRYAIARYAASPAIMAWEMFNEVQWVDAIKKNPAHTGDVAAWHKEMIAYVKGLDPYHHLVTSSSSESLDSGIFDDVDYLQPHTYPANVLASIGGYSFKGKPGFFGEFGPPGRPTPQFPDYATHVRDGIYGGILAGHAGAGMYWFWDSVDAANLGPTFQAARKVIDHSGLTSHPNAQPAALTVTTPNTTDLKLSAGGGWAKSTVTELELPNVETPTLTAWSPYFQSMDGAHKDWAAPLLVKFTAKQPGKLTLTFGDVSTGGGSISVWVNDNIATADEKVDPPTPPAGFGRRRGPHPPIAVPFPAGPVTVRIENHGKDWVRLDSITVPNMAPTATAQALKDQTWALIRITGPDTSEVSIKGLTLPDGHYLFHITDATTATESTATFEIKNGTLKTTHLPPDALLATNASKNRQ